MIRPVHVAIGSVVLVTFITIFAAWTYDGAKEEAAQRQRMYQREHDLAVECYGLCQAVHAEMWLWDQAKGCTCSGPVK